ncbi:hypothetical protein MMC09_000191 [Bachmanniomyces sp. S44760]|nr:hypothetical protein [Bachmanniomyces sp. S44760]
MDSHINPEYYRDPSPQEAHDANLATIAHIKEIDPSHALITPILTPRFAPSCTSPLLAHLGALHSESTYPIQTHISENPSEVSLVKSLFPDSNDYASVYDAHGLLTSHTILAHAIHLTDSEISLIKSRGAKISHCPVSNTSLSSGLCPVRKLLDSGIEVGLGTDVSGGWSPSILVAAREAGTVSRILAAVEGEALAKRLENEATPSTTFTSTDLASPGEEDEDRKNKNNSAATSINHVKLSVEETLHLATRGGAACLGLSHKLGSFEPGKDFDAQYIDLGEIVGASEASGGEASGSNESRGGEAPLTETSPDQQHQQLQTQTQTQEDSETRDSEQAEAEAKQEHHLTHLATQLHEKGGVDLWGTETWEEKLAKWVFTGDERNTRAVWVAGRLVWGGMVGG